MILAFDLDDVLIPFSETLLQWWNGQYGTRFHMEHLLHTDYAAIFGVKPHALTERYKIFDLSDTKKQIKPYDGAQEAVKQLKEKKGYSLHIVTNRPIEIYQETWQWVEAHFPGHFYNIWFCTKDWGKTRVKTKGEVCRSIRARYILEDHPHNAANCMQYSVKVFLFDQPWNRGKLNYGDVKRVSGWKDPAIKALYE